MTSRFHSLLSFQTVHLHPNMSAVCLSCQLTPPVRDINKRIFTVCVPIQARAPAALLATLAPDIR